MLIGQITKILTQKEDDWGRYVVMTGDSSIKLKAAVKLYTTV